MPDDRDVRAMSHPDIVQSTLGDEGVAARVDLGDDALFVTPTRTILYRADKLLSDESVEEFPHGAERVDVSEGRRKATITLDYGLDGERSLTVPASALDRALHPVLAGTLNAAGVTDAGETVMETFRFSELTLVVTSDRVVKHIGNAVWDEEFEEFHYADVTNLAFEEGSVATTTVLTVGDRQERFKTPNDRAREVRERLTQAVLDYHDVDSLDALRETFGVEEREESSARMSFGEGPTPLSVSARDQPDQPQDAEVDLGGDATANADVNADETADPATDETSRSAASGDADEEEQSEPATTLLEDEATGDGVDVVGTGDLLGPVDDTPETAASASDASDAPDESEVAALAAEIEALRESVEAQNEQLARQEELIERLILELRNRL